MAKATIEVTCKNCNNMEIDVEDIKELVRSSNKMQAHYKFLCPECDELQKGSANERTVSILKAIGVRETSPLTEEGIKNSVHNLDEELKELLTASGGTDEEEEEL